MQTAELRDCVAGERTFLAWIRTGLTQTVVDVIFPGWMRLVRFKTYLVHLRLIWSSTSIQ